MKMYKKKAVLAIIPIVLILLAFVFVFTARMLDKAGHAQSRSVFSPNTNYEKFFIYEGGRYIPYHTTHKLESKNPQVNQAVIIIHGTGCNAMDYFSMVRAASLPIQEDNNETLIIAPYLLKTKNVPPNMDPAIIYWKDQPFWGQEKARTSMTFSSIHIDAFTVLDRMIEQIIVSGNFPNLKTITVAGHSAGGQLVNRYSFFTNIDQKTAEKGVLTKYAVLSPNSYVYLDERRLIEDADNTFEVPNDEAIGKSKDYNRYGNGLDHLYSNLVNRGDLKDLTERFKTKKVLYLVGNADTDPQNDKVDILSGAILQGLTRYERANVYFKYLINYYGDELRRYQNLKVVKSDHEPYLIINSKEFINFAFNKE